MKFSDEHLMLKEMVRKRMEAEDIKEMIKKYERHEAEFAWEFVKAMAELGLCGINIPEEYGGAGMDNLSGVIAMMEMSRIWSGGALILGVGNSLVSYPLLKFGAPHHKNKWLPDLAKGKILGSFCLTEPNHGSDAAKIETYAAFAEHGWAINGEKCFITNAPVASFFVVFCRANRALKDYRGISAVVIPADTSGVKPSKPDPKEGLHAAHMGSIAFADAFAPFDSLLGEYGRGFKIAMSTLEHGRNWIAAQAIGGLERAGELAEKRAIDRAAFGSQIVEYSSIYDVLTGIAFAADISKILLFYSAWLEDQGKDFGHYASLAKLFASESLKYLKGRAQDIHGGSGYLLAEEISRVAMDGDVFPIYEGTSNVQRGIILKAWLGDKLQVYPKPPYTYFFDNLKDEARELGGSEALRQKNQRRIFEIADIMPLVAAWHLFDNVFSKNWPKEFMNFQDTAIFADLLLDEIRRRWPDREKLPDGNIRDAARAHLRKAVLT